MWRNYLLWFFRALFRSSACLFYSTSSVARETAGLEGVGDFRPDTLGLAAASAVAEFPRSSPDCCLASDVLPLLRDREPDWLDGITTTRSCHLYFPHLSAPGRSWIILAIVGCAKPKYSGPDTELDTSRWRIWFARLTTVVQTPVAVADTNSSSFASSGVIRNCHEKKK